VGAFILTALVVTAAVIRSRGATPEQDWKAISDATAAQRWPAVESMLRRRLAAHPSDARALLVLGTLLGRLGREAEAVPLLEGISPTEPLWAEAQPLLGEIAIRMRDAPRAERAFRAAADHDPHAFQPRERLVYLLSLQQRSAEARDRLWEMYRISNDPRILVDMVLAPTNSEDVRGLAPELEDFVKKTPNDPFLNRAWGLALLLKGRGAEALPFLERAAETLENDPVGRFALAECRMAQGQSVRDLSAIGTMPSVPADAARWWVLRSRLEEAWGRHDAALASLKAAIAANSDSREAHFRYGQALARKGEAAAGKEHTDRAEFLRRRELALRRAHERVRREALTPEICERRARLCAQSDLTAEARAWLQQAISIDPTRSSAQAELARLPKEPKPLPYPIAHPVLATSASRGNTAHAGRAERAGPPAETLSHLEDLAQKTGLAFQYRCHAKGDLFLADTMGGGVLLLDYDNDGWLDVYFVNGCPLPYDPRTQPGTNVLFRNRGDGTFEDVTARAGCAGLGYGMGGAVGDFDGDGYDDIFVTGLDRTILFRNRGDGTFQDVTARAGVFSPRWTTAAGSADLDGDGDLDLFAVTYVECKPTEVFPCLDQTGRPIHCTPARFRSQLDQLFRNNGDGTFTDISRESGIEVEGGAGLGLALVDLDEDDKLDVFVANDGSRNHLFKNLGNLHFEEIGERAGLAYDGSGRATASMGVVADDLDGDQRIDVLHTNFVNEACTLHHNLGGGLFTDGTLAAGLDAATRPKTGFGAVALDVDNDRQLDLFMANGMVDDRPWINSPMAQTAQLFRAASGGRFELASPAAAPYLAIPVVGRGAAAGDFDNDGRIDVVVIHRDVPAALLHNETRGGHWLGLRLSGTASCRTPVGARVTCRAGGQTVVRWLTGGTGYLAANDPRLWFGLGNAGVVEQLEVRWPSGLVERWSNLPADRIVDLREGAQSTRENGPETRNASNTLGEKRSGR
jgi:tetratricopeptide (TPR) repeat protein